MHTKPPRKPHTLSEFGRLEADRKIKDFALMEDGRHEGDGPDGAGIFFWGPILGVVLWAIIIAGGYLIIRAL